MHSTTARCIVIGIGNSDRGDDAAGRKVAQRLRGMLPSAIKVLEHTGEAASLLSQLQEADLAVLVDACQSGAQAGTVFRFDARAGPLPHATFNVSTHGFGLAEAIELARLLDQLPLACIVYAIEASSFEPGDPISLPVSVGIEEVCDRLRTEINCTLTTGDWADA